MSDYLLCSDCEQRFNSLDWDCQRPGGGMADAEEWVLGNIPRNYGEQFPILDALNAEAPLLADGGTKL